jgi:hypothetical protein
MKPTKEQIEAALRWVNDEWTRDDEMEFLLYDSHSTFPTTVADILAAAYRELSPDVTFGGFRARVVGGKNVIEAATMPRSNRGRPRKIV